MILNKTQLAEDGVQNSSKNKRGCKIAQLTKDRGKVQLSRLLSTLLLTNMSNNKNDCSWLIME